MNFKLLKQFEFDLSDVNILMENVFILSKVQNNLQEI
jgi:hypothetical protein